MSACAIRPIVRGKATILLLGLLGYSRTLIYCSLTYKVRLAIINIINIRVKRTQKVIKTNRILFTMIMLTIASTTRVVVHNNRYTSLHHFNIYQSPLCRTTHGPIN